MTNSKRQIVIACVVIASIVCLCLSVVSIIAAAVFIIQQNMPASISSETDGPMQAATPASVEDQMKEIQEQVIQLRGLQPTADVPQALLTPEELRQHVIDNFLADYSSQDASEDAIILAAFGLLNPDFDLYNFYLELYSEQIAGYYDNETKEMYVVKGEGFEGPERLTYAHEYTHVLQDQVYDFENGLNYNDDACEENSERCAATQALIEGDASKLELEWFSKNATDEDQQQVFDFYGNLSSPVYDSAPLFMQKDFLFAYEKGQEFVEYLYKDGGWQAVDDAYLYLPASTEQILHPKAYPNDVPLEVTLPEFSDALGSGWKELDRNVVGEWYTFLILAYGLNEDGRLDEKQAGKAAEGWQGDAYVVYYNEQDNSTVMVTTILWESPKEAAEYARAFETYANARFGVDAGSHNGYQTWTTTEGFHSFMQNESQTIWILAPGPEAADQVISILP